MQHQFQADIDTIAGISSIPTILDVVCRVTGMGFAAVARVTEGRWIACRVLDSIGLGLQIGSELTIETVISNKTRDHRRPIIISQLSEDNVCRSNYISAVPLGC